jgi:iron complex transport system substrate-binding protein
MKRRTVLLTTAMLAATAMAQRASTREVTDAAGRKLAVPVAPQRVIVLSEKDLDVALALGVKPVGSSLGRGHLELPSHLRERTMDVRNVGAFAQPSLDRVLSLQPDLILAGGLTDPQLLNRLSRIAPTFVSYPTVERWQDTTLRLAELLGRTAQAKVLLSQYQARAQGLRARLGGQAGQSASVVRWTPQGPVYMKDDALAPQVLVDLGLVRPSGQHEPGIGHSGPLSRETLSKIDGDWLFLGAFDSATGHDRDALAALMRQPEFKALRAAQAGQVREVNASLWALRGGPLAALAILEEAAQALLGKP